MYIYIICIPRLRKDPQRGSTDYLSPVSNQQPFRFDSLLDGRRTSLPRFVTRRVKNCSAGNITSQQATRNAKSCDHSILTTTISYNYPQIRWINYQMPEVSVNGLIVFLSNFGRNRKPIGSESCEPDRENALKGIEKI